MGNNEPERRKKNPSIISSAALWVAFTIDQSRKKKKKKKRVKICKNEKVEC